jgi:hypothetical protein
MTKTTVRHREPRFEVEWTSEAWTEVRALPPQARRPVMRAAAALARDAEVETRTQTPLLAPSDTLPKETWETQIRGGHRLLYCVADPARGDSRRRARILRLVIPERDDRGPKVPPAGLPGATMTRAEARELERRAETLRRLGGGIPHEVVRRTWILEMELARGAGAPERS